MATSLRISAVPDEDRRAALPDARDYLDSTINDEVERQTTAMATAAANPPLLLYQFDAAPPAA
jgi:hypothetical protein